MARVWAMPPGSGNYMAELYAIERTLARYEEGDRVLLLCDCSGAMTLVERAWRSG